MIYLTAGLMMVLLDISAGALPLFPASSEIPAPKPSFHGRFTRDTVDDYIGRINDLYKEEVAKRKAVLVFHNFWNSDINNSYAWQAVGTNPMEYHVKIEGGYSRHPAMTEEALVHGICHEVGHHLGGAPLKTSQNRLELGIRVSVEGQADYFASMICFKRVFADHARDLSQEESARIPEALKQSCRRVYGSGNQFKLCLMTISAGLISVEASTEGTSQPPPKLDRNDTLVVDQTIENEPSRQCRLDTVVAGALCNKEEKLFFEDPTQGVCGSLEGEQTGQRPHCWFKQ
ncbi:MAG TPA: hypothetical protein DCZ01_08725 [Elusimicrobia bacterium]|nr:hypothetical protein [Elusimicrobiota bacterium]